MAIRYCRTLGQGKQIQVERSTGDEIWDRHNSDLKEKWSWWSKSLGSFGMSASALAKQATSNTVTCGPQGNCGWQSRANSRCNCRNPPPRGKNDKGLDRGMREYHFEHQIYHQRRDNSPSNCVRQTLPARLCPPNSYRQTLTAIHARAQKSGGG